MAKLLLSVVLLPGVSHGITFDAGRRSIHNQAAASRQFAFLHARAHGGGCVFTTYSVGVNGNDAPYGKFILPVGQVGAVEERPCVFRGQSYQEGVMKFVCKDAEWVFSQHSCKGLQNVTDQCEYTTHKFTLHGHEGKFKLPLSNSGAIEERPCEFEGESYSDGNVRFVCADSKWKLDSHTCSHPVSGACPPTGYDLKISGFEGKFQLPRGQNGTLRMESCAFKDKSFARGELKFLCQDYKWKFTGHSCTDQPVGGCASTKFTVTVNKHPGVFQLPNSPDGQQRETPCEFEDKTYTKGVVKFLCSGGKWSFDESTCSDETA
mmetsp:Transcript_38953/g.61638  ORF Transcript_38953/g.61638 Transcript_38953/m.61638 type:complete len:320 (-) Transcript_38953:30-989(-)|eukprot:CAMPEP_0169083362 /NCGR_PEP_ID=MMETSP1015-20121227/12041_1 /TAXON_ID=342587 /ORGANISM="Karlodinium micrum, Strain CCMP2283" /LENGTH=319 /DNA_ID=CAMNT_0009143287 /DNA_START=89 /DNA_END=1048 /DNA_ORIENTATION=+